MCPPANLQLAAADQDHVQTWAEVECSPLPSRDVGAAEKRPVSEPDRARGDELRPAPDQDVRAIERGAMRIDWRSFLPERAGADISRRYDLDRLSLGEGGDGKVMVARDREMPSRRVAVKKVAKTSVKKTEDFRREIRIMKELDHPNICKLLETFEQGRDLFYVMELLEGGEVFDRIIERGCLPEELAAEIVVQVASALKYGHGRGIAHRDVKPENICFVTTDRGDTHVKLIDWGLGSCFRDAAMRSNVGSHTYAAPEVFTAKTSGDYTSAVDIWSLGVLAYVMLAGAPPFWGSQSNMLSSMRAQRYPITEGVWASISDEAIAFIRAVLNPVPGERLTIEQVLEHPWLTQRSRAADPCATVEVLRNFCASADNSLAGTVCRAAVARQLEHRHVAQIRTVFQELDGDSDGQLSLAELRAGLEVTFGRDSVECARAEELFGLCDLDGSGAISFSEFCAMGLGQLLSTKEEAVWAAFKAFDLEDEGRITEANILELLQRADNQGMWPKELSKSLSREMLGRCGSSGALDFEAWRELVRWSSEGRKESSETCDSSGDAAGFEGNEKLAVNHAPNADEGCSEANEADAWEEPMLSDKLRFAGA
jgi:calcium-dependent protein kinase